MMEVRIIELEKEQDKIRNDFQNLEVLFHNMIETHDARMEAVEDELRQMNERSRE